MKKTAASAAALLLVGATTGQALELYRVCIFDKVPPAVLHYRSTYPATAALSVAGRPPQEMNLGQGSWRFESADVDGLDFRFLPIVSEMQVWENGVMLLAERGRCVFVNGGENDVPLSFPFAAELGLVPRKAEQP